MSKLRLAFLGFRHGHIMGLYQSARKHDRVEVVAACEEHDVTVAALKSAGSVELTHASYDDTYSSIDFDAVAIGDYFARRGELVIAALSAGKHVIVDKPACTSLDEVDRIEKLVAQKRRSLGCLLDLRDNGAYITARRLIREGAIGEVRTLTFTAQHPLNYGSRPAWYFEPGKHGGTLNDIGIHAIDIIPWMTGRRITEAVAARAWNARVKQHPHFQDIAQMLLKLDNDGSVFGDVSYLTPDSAAYSPKYYWRMTIHGDRGFIETGYNTGNLELTRDGDKSPQVVPFDAGNPTGCLDAFLDEIDGSSKEGQLTTEVVLDASRRSLLIQRAADENKTNVAL
jgi:predicted dehydrogenase